MAQCDSATYHVDELIVDGVKIKIEDSSATVSGLAGYENEAIVTAGNDENATKRKRVACIIKAKITLTDLKQIRSLSELCDAQISLRDNHTQQRILFNKAGFMKLGDVGNGAVDIEFLGKSTPIFI